MVARPLRNRIALFFIALLGVVQLVAFMAVDAANTGNAGRKLAAELDTGERIFAQLLAANAARLADAVRVLAADFGFREAIATGDIDTVESVLANHGGRVKADLSLLIGLDGRVVASTVPLPDGGALRDFDDLARAARRDGSATTVELLGGRLYQFVVVPVLAPVPVGWLTMGFEVNDRLARELRDLTDVDVSFAVHGQGWTLLASTLGPDGQAALRAALPPGDPVGSLQVDAGTETFQLRVLALEEHAGGRSYAVLQRSLSAALAAFRPLKQALLGLGLLSLLVSAGGSVVLARGITQPLSDLASAARRIEAGDYESPVPVSRTDEIGVLAGSLQAMGQAVAAREREILRLAFEDSLTGLPNRTCCMDRLGQALRSAARQGERVSVLTLNLDRFRQINDSLGHAVGDHVLQDVGKRLAAALRSSDTVARLGADEFAILLPASGPDASVAMANKLTAALEHPIVYAGQPMDVGASMGIACYPEHGTDAAALMRNAAMAMAIAKQQRTGFAIFDAAYDTSCQEHVYLLGELRRAIDQGELRLYYQPKQRLADGAIVGVEALIRWQHPVRGLVPPAEFIPFAENTGYIRNLTWWALQEAITQAAQWQRIGLRLRISVNISARDLTTAELPGRLAVLLHTEGVDPGTLCLEVTESGFMSDPAHANQVLRHLRELGVHLAIDDYGTGYSSLSYVMTLPVDEIKLDRSFVMALTSGHEPATVIRSTTELGHGLGMEVVAEGVETAAQLALLRDLGVDLAQGYGIAKPMPADQLQHWLAARQLAPVPA